MKTETRRMKGLFTRPSFPAEEMDRFKAACNETGETMTSILRRLVMKVARGDRELLDRIRS